MINNLNSTHVRKQNKNANGCSNILRIKHWKSYEMT